MELVRSTKQVHFDPEFLVEDEVRAHQAQARREEQKVRPMAVPVFVDARTVLLRDYSQTHSPIFC